MARPSSTPSSRNTPGPKAKAEPASPTPEVTNPSGPQESYRGRRLSLLASTFDRLSLTASDREEHDSSQRASEALATLAQRMGSPKG